MLGQEFVGFTVTSTAVTAIFKVLTAVLLKIHFFWDVIACLWYLFPQRHGAKSQKILMSSIIQ
jgi:hypothetical protein